MKKIFKLFTFILLALMIISCDAKTNGEYDYTPGTAEGTYGDGGFYDGGSKTSIGTSSGSMPTEDIKVPEGAFVTGEETAWPTIDGSGKVSKGEEGSGETIVNRPQAGQLTASAWNDYLNYNYWLSLFTKGQDGNDGAFTKYVNESYFTTNNMIEVIVKKGDINLPYVNVIIADEANNSIYVANTNVYGKAYLYPATAKLTSISQIKIKVGEYSHSYPYTFDELTENAVYHQKIINIEDEMTPAEKLDKIELMFVVDTTGSMQDEMIYLISEIEYVIGQVATKCPTSEISLALLFYRDINDEYVTRYFDFSTDIAAQKANLVKQSANGGGDFPEAVDKALDEAINKQWSSGNTTKLLVHVLDAPPHTDTASKMSLYAQSIKQAAAKGITIIPVASSGIDKETEYLLRCEAMMTGGIYTFITNDSGIGGSHIEATVGNTVVEYLNNLLVRLIVEYHTGITQEIIPYVNPNSTNTDQSGDISTSAGVEKAD